MGSLRLRWPDQSLSHAIHNELVLGRSAHLNDPTCSRKQFSVAPVNGGQPALLLKALGVNPMVVERRSGGNAWEPVGMLEAPESWQVREGMRFYVLDRAETTAVEVVAAETPSDAADHGAAGPSSRQWGRGPTMEDDGFSIVEEPDAKRARGNGHVGAAKTSAAAAAEALSAVPGMDQAPFSLLQIRGLPVASNAGCLGARLSDLAVGRIKFALVSNYRFDLRFLLLDCCPTLAEADQVVVVHGERGRDGAQFMQQGLQEAEAGVREMPGGRPGLSQRVTLHQPPLPVEFGTHHSKFMILQYAAHTEGERTYPGGLRIIIHTANYIYGDCHSKAQGLWWQDFPLLASADASGSARPAADGGTPSPSGSAGPMPGNFSADFVRYLMALRLPGNLPQQVRQLFQAHDFSAARAHLVPSVPSTSHRGGDLQLYGHMCLRNLLRQASSPFRGQDLIMQFSSLATFGENWLLKEFGASMLAGPTWGQASGGSGSPRGTSPPSASAAAAGPSSGGSGRGRGVGAFPPAPLATVERDRLRLVWPTVEQIRDSIEGWAAGRSIPGKTKNVSKPFVQKLFCLYGGHTVGRERAMPHIKSFLRHDGQRISWVLLGSHNLGPPAWGNLCDGGKALRLPSYELSVLLLPELEARYLRHPHRGFLAAPAHGEAGRAAAADAAAAAQLQQQQGQQQGQQLTVEFWPVTAYQQHQQQGQVQQQPRGAGPGPVRMYVPLPYELAAPRYAAGQRPWAWDADFEGLDALGMPIRPDMAQLLQMALGQMGE